MNAKETVIEFRDFSFQYLSQKEPTLHNINLTVHKGEKVLIAGPSGCGKSTIVNCINGLIPFSYKGEMKGSLKVNGRETKEQSISALSNIVGTVLQDSDAQFIGMTVLEDIAFALENENVVKSFLGAHEEFSAEDFRLPGGWNSTDGMLTFYPHIHGTDGFFTALLRRNG